MDKRPLCALQYIKRSIFFHFNAIQNHLTDRFHPLLCGVNRNINDGEFTVAPMAATRSVGGTREFIRLPPAGLQCPYTGLSRAYLNTLILACPENEFRPPVQSYLLRRKGFKKGIRLISYPSLAAFIKGHEVFGQESGRSQESPKGTKSAGRRICTESARLPSLRHHK
jgi:hypothetical protein